MAENDKKKVGLQKEVSSIFKGVPIPKNKGAEQPPSSPASNRTGDAPAKSMSPDRQSPQTPPVRPSSAAPNTTGDTPAKSMSPDRQRPQTPPVRPDSAAPNTTGNAPPKPISPGRQSPQTSPVSLLQKLNQPTELLRKGAPAKQFKVKPAIQAIGPGPLQRIKNKLFAAKPEGSRKRKRASIALIPILSIVLIFVLRQVFSTAPRRMKAAEEDSAPSAAVADSDSKVDWEIPAPYPVSLRDPMQLGPAANKQAEAEESKTGNVVELTIKGILYSEDNPTAVIGKQIVHEGEQVAGANIVKIHKDSIEFEKGGKRWRQKIHE